MSNRVATGKLGEQIAASYLQERGYQIMERNYRCSYGEVDLIAWHKGSLVFIEVKTRTNKAFGVPQESVTYAKQQRIRKIALHYLSNQGNFYQNLRFDVVAVLLRQGRQNVIEIIPNAF